MEKIHCPQCHHKTAAHLTNCNECGYPLKDREFKDYIELIRERPGFMSFIFALVSLFAPIRYFDIFFGLLAISLSFTSLKTKQETAFGMASLVVIGLAIILKSLSLWLGWPIYLL